VIGESRRVRNFVRSAGEVPVLRLAPARVPLY